MTWKKTNVVLDYYIYTDKGAKRNAAKNIKTLLRQLDETAERVPENNRDKLMQLIVYLKGSELSKEETELLEIIANP